MFLLARYTIREHIGPFLFSLAVIMFVFVTKFIVQYIGKIFGKGLSIGTIIEFIYLNLAWMLALAVPMSVLVAALMAFGRLSSDNEITILKTSGISIYKIIRPALIATIFLTIFMFWFTDKVLPEYNHKARLLFSSISRKKPTLQLEEGIYMNLGKYSILVEDVERSLGEEVIDNSNIIDPEYVDNRADRLKDITIFDRSSSDLQRTIIAATGRLVFDKVRESLVFTLYNGEIHEINTKDYSEYRRLQFTRNVFYIPAPDLVFKGYDRLLPRSGFNKNLVSQGNRQ
ncbi:MAG: LptF/LptG family permease [Calditrichia bacterium]